MQNENAKKPKVEKSAIEMAEVEDCFVVTGDASWDPSVRFF